MRIESRIGDLHAAIDAEWQRKQEEGMKERDVNCEEFFGDSIAKLNELADKDTCPECEGTNLSDAGRCRNCTANDYQEEE